MNLARLTSFAEAIFSALPKGEVSINLTGGEPLLMPELIPLLTHLQSYPNLKEVNIITNGTIAEPTLLDRLGGMVKLNRIKISLEAGDEAINDRIRGAGSFRRVMDNLPLFHRHTARSIVLMITLAKYNLNQIEPIVGVAKEQGLAGVIFERFVPLGRGHRLATQRLSAADWRTAVASIARVAGLDDVPPAELAEFRAFWLEIGPDGDTSLQGARCNLGNQSMALMPDGTVFPCRRLPVVLGRLGEQPFGELSNALTRFDRANPIHSFLRAGGSPDGEGACLGCRAIAFNAVKMSTPPQPG